MPQTQTGPWTKYQSGNATASGPWTKYQSSPVDPTTTDSSSPPKPPVMGTPRDINQDLSPSGMLGARLRDTTLDFADLAGIDPSSPIIGTATNLYKSLKGAGSSVIDAARQSKARQEARRKLPLSQRNVKASGKMFDITKSPLAQSAMESPREMMQGISEGDWTKTGHGLVGTAGEVIGAVAGVEGAFSKAKSLGFASNPKLKLPSPSKSSQYFSDAVGGRRSVQLQSDIQESFDRAKNFLKRSEKDHLKGTVLNKNEGIEVGKNAYNRIYTEDIKPFIDATPEVDFRPLAEKLKAQIPDHFTDKERIKAIKTIDSQFNKVLDGKKSEALRQKLRAEDKVNVIANDYDRAAVEKTARGWTLKNMYESARNHIADTVQTYTGQDIRPALGNYGAVSDVTQHMVGSPVDPSLLQRIEGTYFTASPYNIRGRVSQITGSMMKSSDRYVRKAFANIDSMDIAPTPPPRLALPSPADTSYVRGIDATGQRLMLNAAPPVPTEIPTGPMPSQRLMGAGAQDAKVMPLPSTKTGLNYGAGRYSDEMPNYQFSGETKPSQLSRPEGAGVMRRTESAAEHTKAAKERARLAREKHAQSKKK